MRVCTGRASGTSAPVPQPAASSSQRKAGWSTRTAAPPDVLLRGRAALLQVAVEPVGPEVLSGEPAQALVGAEPHEPVLVEQEARQMPRELGPPGQAEREAGVRAIGIVAGAPQEPDQCRTRLVGPQPT